MTTTTLRRPRAAALISITMLAVAAAAASFAESYRALVLWALAHGLHGAWALIFPVQVDSFIAVGELALFVALADAWTVRSRAGAWLVTVLGLAASVAANVGHVAGHSITARATAAIPPLAASAALAVGLGVLKRVVAANALATATAVAEAPTVGGIETVTTTGRPPLSLAWPRVTDNQDWAAVVQSVAEPASTPAVKRTARSASPASRDRKAAAIVAGTPDISGAELGRKLGVSERTGRRMLACIMEGSAA